MGSCGCVEEVQPVPGNYYLHRKLLFTDEIIIYIGLPGVHLVCVQDEWGALLVNYYLQMKLLFS